LNFACSIVIGSSRALTSSLVRSPDTTENWRKIAPIAARRAKPFYRQIDMFERTRLLPAWGDSPKIRPYIGNRLSLSARTPMAPLHPQKLGTSK